MFRKLAGAILIAGLALAVFSEKSSAQEWFKISGYAEHPIRYVDAHQKRRINFTNPHLRRLRHEGREREAIRFWACRDPIFIQNIYNAIRLRNFTKSPD